MPPERFGILKRYVHTYACTCIPMYVRVYTSIHVLYKGMHLTSLHVHTYVRMYLHPHIIHT